MAAATLVSAVAIEPVAIEPVAIESGNVYPLQEFQRRSRLGKAAMRKARRKGLVVRYVGNRGFVSGDDFLKYLAAQRACDRLRADPMTAHEVDNRTPLERTADRISFYESKLQEALEFGHGESVVDDLRRELKKLRRTHRRLRWEAQ